MDTCVRGFSFMSESKADLQFIEGGELERAWRTTRRERMKQREQKIWNNFVKEQDAVKDVCNDDPYQFLDPLPESCIKEMMDKPQSKETTEKIEEEPRVKEQAQHGTGDISTEDDAQHTCVVTFAEDMARADDGDIFYIFEDDQSGGEDENLNESNSPDTVREKTPEPAEDAAAGQQTLETETREAGENELKQSSSKSSENVTSVIESSIYCARVRELRAKINEELIALMTSLDRRDILLTSEPEDIARMVKRSAEFCNRFNRIHMYQLQRQIHDIKRNNSQSLPFAKHTQFQSQMTRIVSLHQNLLQSFMVFHKSLTSTCCVRESAGALGSLLAAARDASHCCRAVPPPNDFAASRDLYDDDLLTTCDKVDEFVNEYAIRCEEFLNRFESTNSVSSKKPKKEIKTKKRLSNNKHFMKSGTDSQLSMYSMDTRLNYHVKSSTSSKAHQTGSSSKMRNGAGAYLNAKKATTDKNSEAPKSTRRSRRPLMRDPHAGKPRAPKLANETDIQTMVEAVGTCASSHISCEDSPRAGTRPLKRNVLRRPQPPRSPRLPRSPHPPHPSHSSHPAQTPASSRAAHASHASTPLQRTPRVDSLNLATPRSLNQHAKKLQPSPRPTRLLKEASPSRSKPSGLSPKSTQALKDSLSFIKNEQDAEEQQVMPVLTIKCAMKKDLKAEEVEAKPSPTKREVPKEMRVYEECRAELSPRKSRSPTSRAELSPSQHLRREMERNQVENGSPDRLEVTRLLKQLCSGDGAGSERVTGAKNAQLLYVSGNSPRQPSTPQLLRILEETIKKKIPKPLFQQPSSARKPDRHRLQFNINDSTADALFQYRTKFVQHMLTSSMYANSAVGKPWEMIGNISEQLIDEVLLKCVSKMELRELIQELYKKETTCR